MYLPVSQPQDLTQSAEAARQRPSTIQSIVPVLLALTSPCLFRHRAFFLGSTGI
jgi:hypothetical protein